MTDPHGDPLEDVVTGPDDWLVSTVRYFEACPVCGRRERGGEITYATPAEVATAEQTHGCLLDRVAAAGAARRGRVRERDGDGG